MGNKVFPELNGLKKLSELNGGTSWRLTTFERLRGIYAEQGAGVGRREKHQTSTLNIQGEMGRGWAKHHAGGDGCVVDGMGWSGERRRSIVRVYGSDQRDSADEPGANHAQLATGSVRGDEFRGLSEE